MPNAVILFPHQRKEMSFIACNVALVGLNLLQNVT